LPEQHSNPQKVPRFGPGERCFVIAEAGVNHNGQRDLACKLVEAAAEAGADAVKFQIWRTEDLVTAEAAMAKYQQENLGKAGTQFAMLKALELSREDFRAIQEHCVRCGILFLATPFDHASATQLDQFGVPLFKISSGDATNLPFLQHVARFGKPIILSTGMCDLAEVTQAVDAIRAAGNEEIVLLQCVSDYPAQAEDTNLRAMQTLATACRVPVGYSDHTLGNEVALAAVALGACVIEKHLTLDRKMSGPDHAASAEGEDFRALVHGIRRVEAALGDGRKMPAATEGHTAAVARKSLVAARDLAAGEIMTEMAIAIKRPGTGLPPARRGELLGRKVRAAIPAGTLLTLEMFT